MSRTVVDFPAAADASSGSELIYEVTLDVSRRAARRFDVWLEGHMRAMLALPGFLGASVLPADQVAPAAAAHCVRRVVRYRLLNYAALRSYLAEHGARMRAEALRAFGRQLHTSRRLLDVEGRELLSGDVLPPTTLRCLNCNAALAGEYCSNCGQPHHSVTAPLRKVAGEFFGEHFGLDTKLIRSALPLLFRPGFLSREYSAGRRVRYISPLRLYVFCSLLFFFVAWGSSPRQFFTFNAPAASASAPQSASLTKSQQQEIRDTPYLTAEQKQAIFNATAVPASRSHSAKAQTAAGAASKAAAHAAGSSNQNLEIFGRHIDMPRSEFQSRVQSGLEHDLPKFIFLFLPIVALLLTLFYLRTRRYYVEHLVFTLHNHAFVFAAMLVMLLAGWAARHAHWLAALVHYFNLLLGWYIVVYIFLAMLFYYRQPFVKTLGKYLLIGGIYWICLLSVFILGTMWVLTRVAA